MDVESVKMRLIAFSGNGATLADDALRVISQIESERDELKAKLEAYKSRGDNHWETLRSIRDIAKTSADIPKIIQWVNDAGSGYTETNEVTMARLIDDNAHLKAKLAEMEKQEPLIRDEDSSYHHWTWNCKNPDIFMDASVAAKEAWMARAKLDVAKPKPSAPAQRITEQDAREILKSYTIYHPANYIDEFVDEWIASDRYKNLLAKLNEHREPEANLKLYSTDQYIDPRGDGVVAYYLPSTLNESKSAGYHERVTLDLKIARHWSSHMGVKILELKPVTANKAEVPSLGDFEKFISDLKEIVWLDAVKEEDQPSFEDSGIELYMEFINKFFKKEYEAAKNGEIL